MKYIVTHFIFKYFPKKSILIFTKKCEKWYNQIVYTIEFYLYVYIRDNICQFYYHLAVSNYVYVHIMNEFVENLHPYKFEQDLFQNFFYDLYTYI